MGEMELHTDHLRRETGSGLVVCDVLYHNTEAGKRLAVLSTIQEPEQSEYMIKTPQSVAYASLNHPEAWNPKVRAVDAKLADLSGGRLMGETFRAARMDVRQNRLFRMWSPLGSPHLAELYNTDEQAISEVECYEFWADQTLYAVVAEIKNPLRTKLELPHLGLGSFLHWQGISRQEITSWIKDASSINPEHLAKIAVARHMGRRFGTTLYADGLHFFNDYQNSQSSAP